MAAPPESEIEQLVERVSHGDRDALQPLLSAHRDRLRQMVALRMDARLAARVDPSDIVQEALAEACRRIAEFARRRPLPFYPWLRKLAFDRLADAHRRHLLAQRRSVDRECHDEWPLPGDSAEMLVERLAGGADAPADRILRDERRNQVRLALMRLRPRDRDVLILRYLEQLSVDEAAAALEVSKATFMKRHVRALTRLRRLLTGEVDDEALE